MLTFTLPPLLLIIYCYLLVFVLKYWLLFEFTHFHPFHMYLSSLMLQNWRSWDQVSRRKGILLLLAMLLAFPLSLFNFMIYLFYNFVASFFWCWSEFPSYHFSLGWCSYDGQWWCSYISASEWGEGTSIRVASNCKDQRLCWCSSGTLNNIVHIYWG